MVAGIPRVVLLRLLYHFNTKICGIILFLISVLLNILYFTKTGIKYDVTVTFDKQCLNWFFVMSDGPKDKFIMQT